MSEVHYTINLIYKSKKNRGDIMTKGIYILEINNKQYIGKDTQINIHKRLKEHMNLLKKGVHYNKHLQRAYDKYQELIYNELIEFNDISNEDLSKCEMFYIDLFDTYENGFNQTKGGEGAIGFIVSEQERINRSIRYTGEKNPLSKISNEDFYSIVELLKQGKSNKEIADQFNLNDRYVSLIRHKKRFKNLWDTVKDYQPVKSDDQPRGINKETFIEIVNLINLGWTNAAIENKYNLSSGSGSRIRHKKLYKKWWEECFNE